MWPSILAPEPGGLRSGCDGRKHRQRPLFRLHGLVGRAGLEVRKGQRVEVHGVDLRVHGAASESQCLGGPTLGLRDAGQQPVGIVVEIGWPGGGPVRLRLEQAEAAPGGGSGFRCPSSAKKRGGTSQQQVAQQCADALIDRIGHQQRVGDVDRPLIGIESGSVLREAALDRPLPGKGGDQLETGLAIGRVLRGQTLQRRDGLAIHRLRLPGASGQPQRVRVADRSAGGILPDSHVSGGVRQQPVVDRDAPPAAAEGSDAVAERHQDRAEALGRPRHRVLGFSVLRVAPQRLVTGGHHSPVHVRCVLRPSGCVVGVAESQQAPAVGEGLR